MKIVQGLFDHIVVQRNRKNVSEAAFGGTSAATGVVWASVKANGRTLTGFSNVEAGAAAKGRLAGCLKGVPAGGPYDIELRIDDAGGKTLDSLTVSDVLVGDVWILGGQSNMQGVGLLKDAPKPHPLVRAFYMDDQWRPAKDPIHNMWKTVDQVHIDISGGVRPEKNIGWGVGPGVSFAQRMRELTGVPQGVLACAHGGTCMTQWDPALKGRGGSSLYGAMLRRFRKNGSRVKGMAWYQGCSDANPDAAPAFTARMKTFVASVRRDCGDPALPVVMVQIATVIGWGTAPQWNMIQEQQRRMPELIKNCAVVPAIDLPIADPIHISGAGQIRLGRRMAEAMMVLWKGRHAGRPPIALKKVSVVKGFGGMGDVIVEFDNVAGQLQSGSRPSGFAVVIPNQGSCVYAVELAGSRAIVHTSQPAGELAQGALYYGYGTEPYCNIVDAADRSLPVFGPVRLGQPRAIGTFVQALRVSEVLPSAGKLNSLACPKLRSLSMQARTFPGPFCDVHAEMAKCAPEDVLVYYACRIECSERMKLAAVLGYDGPVKMWVDGKKRYHDPDGTNPAAPSDASVPFAAGKGVHEIVFAFGSNCGRAWGIFLRFERLDVPAKVMKLGPAHYAMPKILG